MLNFIKDNIAGILLIVSLFVEITPIKINPISWLGEKLNKSTNDRIDEMDKEHNKRLDNITNNFNDKLDEIKKQIDNNHQEDAKILISDFVNDIKSGEKKSQPQWIAIMNYVDEYLKKGWNSEIKHDAKFIKLEYDKRFLK